MLENFLPLFQAVMAYAEAILDDLTCHRFLFLLFSHSVTAYAMNLVWTILGLLFCCFALSYNLICYILHLDLVAVVRAVVRRGAVPPAVHLEVVGGLLFPLLPHPHCLSCISVPQALPVQVAAGTASASLNKQET